MSSGETDKMHNSVYILIVLISLSSWTFANVEFVTEPPEEVRTFPGQNVTLPCVLENLIEGTHTVEWHHLESYDLHNTISNNREVLITNLTNVGQHFSILGDGMNFTLLIKIPDENSTDFRTFTTIPTSYRCSVVDRQKKVLLTTTSNVIIQKWKFLKPICSYDTIYYVIGETLKLGCFNDSNPTIITTWKSDGQVLPTITLNMNLMIHNFTVTKGDHNTMFVCESKRNGTNEIQSCSVGPITVKHEITTITQTSPLEFLYTAEARPPVNVTRWIVEPSTPEDSFTISNEVLKITEQLKVDSKITIEVENTVRKETKTLNIPGSYNQDEEEGNDSISVVITVVSVLSCVVAVFFIILIWFLRRKRNQRQHESKKSKNTVKFGRHDHGHDQHQVKTKNQDPKELEYDYAAINVNEFHAEYQETENEIYVDGDRLSNDENNTANNKLSYKKREDLDQYRENENEIYEGPNMDTDSKGEGMKGEKQQVYSQVNKPDYKECEN